MRKLLIVLLLVLVVACSGSQNVERIIEVPVEVVKTEYINKIQYDSVYIRDSIDRYIKGDTVFLTKVQKQIRYKLKKDTVLQRDTVPKIVTVSNTIEKVVEVNKLSSWQHAFIKLGEVMLLLLLGSLVYVIFKIYRKLK